MSRESGPDRLITENLAIHCSSMTLQIPGIPRVYARIIKANTHLCFWIYWNKSFKKQQQKNSKKESKMNKETKRKNKTYLTFKHCKLGTGVDLTSTVGGCALVNGFVSVCAQWLDPQYGARAIIKLNHLGKQKGRNVSFPRKSIY